MRVAKIRRLHARRTAENLPMGGPDRRSAEALEPTEMGLPRNAASDGGDASDSPQRLESELRQVPLFLRRRRL
jgi:hypothetical protein